MEEERKTYTIHKSKESQNDRSLSAGQKLRKNLENTPYRVDTVAVYHGVEYVCDTRASDLLATRDTFKYISKPMVWISATTHLERDYSLLEKYVGKKVRAIVTYGHESTDMRRKLEELVEEFKAETTLDTAVQTASVIAKSGDAVVFSPSCKPLDGYTNYFDRGNAFKIIIEQLAKK